MELVPNSTLTTRQLRSHFKLSRADAVAIKDRSVNGDGVAEGVAAYKGGESYKKRQERRDKQGNGLNAKPRLCGWTRKGCGGKAEQGDEETILAPLHMNTNEPAVGLVTLSKSSKKPTAEGLATKVGKFPKRAS